MKRLRRVKFWWVLEENTFQYCSPALRYFALSFLVQFSAEMCPSWNSHITPIFVAVWPSSMMLELTWLGSVNYNFSLVRVSNVISFDNTELASSCNCVNPTWPSSLLIDKHRHKALRHHVRSSLHTRPTVLTKMWCLVGCPKYVSS